MRTTSLQRALGIAAASTAVIVAATGCGTTAKQAAAPAASRDVHLTLTAPATGLRTSADHVAVRGTVSPAGAVVQIQGRPAAVGNGVFTGTATVHHGTTTIDVVASAPGATPVSTSVAITRPVSHTKAKTTVAPKPVVITVPTSTQSAPVIAPARDSGCDDRLVAGPNTTCPFAENVRAAYEQHGLGRVVAYSPVTRRSYVMTCAGGAPVVCSGGNDASVTIW
jgi:hypothetical protein